MGRVGLVGRRLALTLVAVGSVVAGGAGCTETLMSSERVIPEGPLTHAEFVEAADAACRREAVNELRGGDLGGASAGDLEAMFVDVLVLLRDTADAQVAALRLLPVPEGEEEQVGAILDAFDAVVAHLDEAIAAGGRADPSDTTGVPADPTTSAAYTGLTQWRSALLREYGITACD